MTQASASNLSAAFLSRKAPTFILVDGHSRLPLVFCLCQRRDGGLLTSTGIPTSVCFGFLKTLLEVMASEQPEAMAIAFDLGLPPSATKPTTPIKQTDQAHRKTSFPI